MSGRQAKRTRIWGSVLSVCKVLLTVKCFLLLLFILVEFYYLLSSFKAHSNYSQRCFLQGLRAFAGSDPRVLQRKGNVLLMDLIHPDGDPEILHLEGNINKDDFNPHGLSTWICPESGTNSLSPNNTILKHMMIVNT